MCEEIYKRKINYFLGNESERNVSIFETDFNYDKLYQLIKNLPNIVKDETFDIIRLKRNSYKAGEIYPDLSSVLHYPSIYKNYFNILDFSYNNDDVFYDASTDSTDAYNVYVKWEEKSELAIYLSQFLEDGRVTREIDLELSKIVEGINLLPISNLEKKQLFENIIECFQFSLIEKIQYDTVNLIQMSSYYELFDLSKQNTKLTKILDLGKKNCLAMNFDYEKSNDKYEESKTLANLLFDEKDILKEKGAFGKIASFLEDYNDLKQQNYIKFTISNDDGSLYRYRGTVDYLNLYKWINEVNEKYPVQKERHFEVIPWDCYKRMPILDNFLDSSILESRNYQIIDIDISNSNIDIRKRIATNVFIKWKEVPTAVIIIEKILSDFQKNPELDLSKFVNAVEAMDISKDEKKNIINQFFSNFDFDLFEIVPSTVLSAIHDLPSSRFLNLEKAKLRLEKGVTLGKENYTSCVCLEDNKVKLMNINTNAVISTKL